MPSTEICFRTPVRFNPINRPFSVLDRFVFLGSCFSEHIGGLFHQYGLSALSNPLGVLYNPKSIAAVVARALESSDSPLLLFERQKEWYSWLAGTQLHSSTEEECKALMNDCFQRLGKALREANFLILTLGTPVCYVLKESGQVVANCHKMPSSSFQEYTLCIEECTEVFVSMLQLLQSVNPTLQVVFTVSPYRYAKYGFHGNQLAKATLLLSIDRLCRCYPHSCSYLPVYEVFMDELRDYRFYASDMLHPNEVAVDYVWHRLKTDCMDHVLQSYLTEIESIRRFFQHRPSDPLSSQYLSARKKTEEQIDKLRKKYGLPVPEAFLP